MGESDSSWAEKRILAALMMAIESLLGANPPKLGWEKGNFLPHGRVFYGFFYWFFYWADNETVQRFAGS